MTDYIRDLDEVVRLAGLATPGEWHTSCACRGLSDGSIEVTEHYVYSPDVADDVALAADVIDPKTCKPSKANAEAIAAAVNYIRQHHAAIRRDAEDARLFRALYDEKTVYWIEIQSQPSGGYVYAGPAEEARLRANLSALAAIAKERGNG